MYNINGYEVSEFYAGMSGYAIYKGGKYINQCFALSDLARLCGTTLEEVKKILNY